MSTSASTGPARQSLIAKASAAVAARPSVALAVIVVMTIVVIATLVYYRGLLGLGPYNKSTFSGKPPLAATAAAASSGGAAPSSDAETERLISAINGEPGA